MKNKKILNIFVVLVVMIAVVLASCSKFKTGITLSGDKATAETISNSGLILKHGEYKYFINGYVPVADIKEPSHNEFGKMKKGALYRVKDASPELVVPTVIFSNAKESGIAIFGGWIYYTTPSTDLHKTTGAIQTAFLNYMRTSLDGKKTQLIATIKGNEVNHKFTKDGLVYFKDNTLYVRKYDEKSVNKKEKEIATNIETVILPYSKDTSKDMVGRYAFYTTKTEDYLEGSKIIKIDIDGNKEELQIDKAEYSMETYFVSEDKVTVMFKKSKFNGQQVENLGLYRVELNQEGKFVPDSLTQITSNSVSKPLIVADNEVLYLKDQRLVVVKNGVEQIFKNAFTASIDLIGKKDHDLIYVQEGHLYKLDISDGATSLPVKISNTKILLSWYKPEILEEDVYYIAETDKQLYKNNITDNNKEGILVGEKIEIKEKK